MRVDAKPVHPAEDTAARTACRSDASGWCVLDDAGAGLGRKVNDLLWRDEATGNESQIELRVTASEGG